MRPHLVRRATCGSVVALTLFAPATCSVGLDAAGGVAATTLVPPTQRLGGVCTVSGPSPTGATSSEAPPTVPKNPTGIDIVWLPGLNTKPCKTVATRAGAHRAAALARDIDQARVSSSTVSYHCPVDDDTSAHLVFTYAHQGSQAVIAQLSGCSWIVVPRYAMRFSTPEFRRDLTTMAPSPWRPYISSNPDPSG